MSSPAHALRWSLPDEVVLKIVFSIPGRKELSNFIKALGPYYAVDLLEHLRQDWWPYLVLRPAFQTNAHLSSFEQVAKHFTKVRVFNSFDLNLLTAHVDPMADQEWKFDTFDGIPDDFWTKWATSQRISVVKSYVRSG
ncbi:hypothetical protein AC1031_011255 [Aphanomyces cochlioides]|nr:hypothetical protein AC1031_011255 [Aphanomyces cochlioides]